MKRLYILTFCSVIAACVLFLFKKDTPTTIPEGKGLVIKKEWLVQNKSTRTPRSDCRPADQTFLTFPEWYLVFSPEEQAAYFRHHTASTFPFMRHTAQIWESYSIVNDQIKGNFPTNTGYHFMIWVIGTSASVEYAIKAGYETIIGRMTDTYEVKTDEDTFNAAFTRDYVDFIKDRPWYEFDFKGRLTDLWTSTSFWGDNLIRKMERKYILTSELSAKYLYGKIIGIGTKTVYDEALPTTTVIVNDTTMINIPRYDKFNHAITELAVQGNHITEIAGNTSAIVLTILVPSNSTINFPDAQIVFTQPIASAPATKRIALATPVPSLSKLLMQLHTAHIMVEHVFDY